MKTIAVSSQGVLADPLDRPIFIREDTRPAEAVWIWGPRLIPVRGTATFWVRIPPATTLSVPAAVTPSDNGAGGHFEPSSVESTTASPMASFTYTVPTTPMSARITLAVAPQGIPGTRWDVMIAAEATTYSVLFDGLPVLPAGKASDIIQIALPACRAYLTDPSANTITLSDGGAGGTFYPPSVTLSTTGNVTRTCYAPPANATGQAIRLSATSAKAGISNPPEIVGQVLAAATTYLVSGPATATCGIPVQYTVAIPPDTAIGVPAVVSISDGGAGGTIEPLEILLTNQQPVATFMYTAKVATTVTLSFTNSTQTLPDMCVILSDPAPITVVCVADPGHDPGPDASGPCLRTEAVPFGCLHCLAAGGWHTTLSSDRDPIRWRRRDVHARIRDPLEQPDHGTPSHTPPTPEVRRSSPVPMMAASTRQRALSTQSHLGAGRPATCHRGDLPGSADARGRDPLPGCISNPSG